MRNIRNSQYLTQVQEIEASHKDDLVPEVGALIYVDEVLYMGNGTEWLIVNVPTRNYGLFAQTVSSTPITNTTTESSLIGTGVGSLTVPANGFKVGDSFHAKLIGHISCNSSATIDIKIKADGVILANTGVIDLDTCTNKHWEINIYFTIRSLGSDGVASISSGGIFSYTRNASTNFEGSNFSIINNTTFDTTISNTLDITAKWGSANAADSIYSEIFILNKMN